MLSYLHKHQLSSSLKMFRSIGTIGGNAFRLIINDVDIWGGKGGKKMERKEEVGRRGKRKKLEGGK
jgi:hypothetical protein